MNCSTPGLPVHHQLLESTQTHVHRVGDAIQPSHPLLSPSPPALSLSQHQGLFKWVNSSYQVAKVLEFQLKHQSLPGLMSFRMDWLDLLVVQGTLKSLLQHHSSKASILQSSAFFIVQLSHPYMTTGKTIALTRQIFVGKVMSLLFTILSAAAAAAKLLQLCPTLCNPRDGSPPGYPILGILQTRTLEWVAVSFSNEWKWKVKGKSLSRVWLPATPWTTAHQAPPSMGFSRQEYWSGVPLPSPTMLSRLVITFLPRSKHLLISWLQSPSAVILEPRKIKSATVSTVSPSICHQVMGPDAMILVFWMLRFKPTFSLSSFTFIKRLFSSFSLSAIRVVSSAYLRLLIFLPAILIPACASSTPVFLMMYSACKLNKQGDNIQPWCTPFPIWLTIYHYIALVDSCLGHTISRARFLRTFIYF